MKYLSVLLMLSATSIPVVAADNLFLRPSYPEQTISYDQSPWSRPYIGVFGGVASANHHYGIEIPGAAALDIVGGGLLGGIRAGYDYAAGDMLMGAAVDLSATNIRAGGTLTVGAFNLNGDIESKVSTLLNLKGRFGFTQKSNLFYVHGGPSFGWVDITANGNEIPGIIRNTRVGYTVGAGYERALTEGMTFQTEYSYTNLGKSDIYLFPPALHEEISFHAMTAGINMRF